MNSLQINVFFYVSEETSQRLRAEALAAAGAAVRAAAGAAGAGARVAAAQREAAHREAAAAAALHAAASHAAAHISHAGKFLNASVIQFYFYYFITKTVYFRC